jgi:hypothetical protein
MPEHADRVFDTDGPIPDGKDGGGMIAFIAGLIAGFVIGAISVLAYLMEGEL